MIISNNVNSNFGGSNALQIISNSNGYLSISQNFNNLSGGQKYRLSFNYAANQNANLNFSTFNVLWNNAIITQISPNSTNLFTFIG